MIRLFAALLALGLAAPAGASRLDELPERIALLGQELADAYLAACLEELPAGERSDALRAIADDRGRLKEGCQAAYDAWSRAAARLDESGDFTAVERHQRELLPCWDEIEATRRQVRSEARRCLDRVRAPRFPLAFSELDTRADLADSLRCAGRDPCELRPEAIPSRDPGWLGKVPHRVALGFSPVGIEQILTSVFAVRGEASCEAARERLRAWRQHFDAAWEGDLGEGCAPATLVAAIGDHLVVLLLADEGSAFVAGALVAHDPWRMLRERVFSPYRPSGSR